jgi:hypothetical protein
VQHINFYLQLAQKQTLLLSAKQQLQAVAVIAAVLVLYAVYLWFANTQLRAELADAQQQQRQVEAVVEDLRKEKIHQLKDKTIEQQVAALERDIGFRRYVLNNVAPSASKASNFSEHLQGLARQQIDGLWFTLIHLQQGGDQLALNGFSRRPEYLPRYLQKLSSEPVYAGHNFSVFRMSLPEPAADNLLSFEVRAKEVDKARE